MAVATLSGSVQASVTYAANNAGPASALGMPGPGVGPTTVTLKLPYLTGNLANQANEVFSLVNTLGNSASVVINMQTQSDVLGIATVALIRLKSFLLAHLSVAQDATAGGNSSSVTFSGNSVNPFVGPLGGTGPTYTLNNGGYWLHGDPSAAGQNINTAVNQIKLLNNDSGNSAGTLFIPFGATT